VTDDAKDGEGNVPEAAGRRLGLSAAELLVVAGLWALFGALNAVAGHGAFAAGLHAVGAVLTLGCAGLARLGRARLAFHAAATVALAALLAFSVASGTASDGLLVLVVVPALATYVDSARAGLVWLAITTIGLVVVRLVQSEAHLEPIFVPAASLREAVILALAAILWLFAQRARSRSDAALERLTEREREARARADDLSRLKQALEEKNGELDALNAQFARTAREVSEMNVEIEDARDAALHRAKEAVEFLNRMSHEIRTPLNGILGITDVLLGGELERETREHVAIIDSSGRVLRRLVDEVLDLARLDAGKLHLVEEPFDPLTVAEDVADLFAAQAFSKGVALVMVAPEAPTPRLLGDPMRVRQVLQNLVGNAVKFTAQGHVRIDVDAAPGELRFRVEDSGPGMSPEALAGLFREYAQDREGARRGGSGLGLVIARRLARAMGGDVEVESTVGSGSIFTARFALPRASTQNADVGELSGTVAEAALVAPDDLCALALVRTAALVNVHLRRFESLEAASRARPRPAVIFVAGETSPVAASESPTVIRLRSPAAGEPSQTSGLALLLPPRRARLVRALRRARGRPRDITREMVPVAPTGMKALVVDDEPVNLKVASLMLARQGWAALAASTGAEALALAEGEDRIDAAMIDLDMPALDGIETARALARLARPGRMPWLVLQTASIDEAARTRAREAGVVDFLPKPVDAVQLREVLLRATRHRRAEDRRATRHVRRPAPETATQPVLALLDPLVHCVISGEAEAALGQLGELQALARRRQLDRVDRACSALHDALLEGEGVEALVDLEEAIAEYAAEASVAAVELA
jgi:signal transduction histidine kinase/DNA-binding response OmpR family regulator